MAEHHPEYKSFIPCELFRTYEEAQKMIDIHQAELKRQAKTIIKKAKRTNRKYPLTETLLMMFRSANREFIKSLKEQESKSDGTV